MDKVEEFLDFITFHSLPQTRYYYKSGEFRLLQQRINESSPTDSLPLADARRLNLFWLLSGSEIYKRINRYAHLKVGDGEKQVSVDTALAMPYLTTPDAVIEYYTCKGGLTARRLDSELDEFSDTIRRFQTECGKNSVINYLFRARSSSTFGGRLMDAFHISEFPSYRVTSAASLLLQLFLKDDWVFYRRRYPELSYLLLKTPDPLDTVRRTSGYSLSQVDLEWCINCWWHSTNRDKP